MPESPPSRLEGPSADAQLNYAWGWFQYHGSQRLTAFNFFLVLIGLLFVTFAQAANHDWVGVGCAIGLLGALVSSGFWFLDVRNQELIACGLNALRKLEDEAKIRVVPLDEDERDNLPDAFGRSPCGTSMFSKWAGGGWGSSLVRHRTWLRLIMAAVGLMFVAGTVWAGLGYPAPSNEKGSRHESGPRVQVELGGAIINSTR